MNANKIVRIVEDREKRLVFIELRKGNSAVRLSLDEVNACAYRMEQLLSKADELQQQRRSPRALARAANKMLKNAGFDA